MNKKLLIGILTAAVVVYVVWRKKQSSDQDQQTTGTGGTQGSSPMSARNGRTSSRRPVRTQQPKLRKVVSDVRYEAATPRNAAQEHVNNQM